MLFGLHEAILLFLLLPFTLQAKDVMQMRSRYENPALAQMLKLKSVFPPLEDAAMPSILRGDDSNITMNPANLTLVNFNPTCEITTPGRLCKALPCTFAMFEPAENMLNGGQYGDFAGGSELSSMLKQILISLKVENNNGTVYDYLREEFAELARLGLVQDAEELNVRSKDPLLSHRRRRQLRAFMTFSLPDVHFKLSHTAGKDMFPCPLAAGWPFHWNIINGNQSFDLHVIGVPSKVMKNGSLYLGCGNPGGDYPVSCRERGIGLPQIAAANKKFFSQNKWRAVISEQVIKSIYSGSDPGTNTTSYRHQFLVPSMQYNCTSKYVIVPCRFYSQPIYNFFCSHWGGRM